MSRPDHATERAARDDRAAVRELGSGITSRPADLSTATEDLAQLAADLRDHQAMPISRVEWSIGERVAFYRRRRGLTQETLAGLVGRTTSWVEKIENGRAALDRISVLRELAAALAVPFSALVAEETAVPDAGTRATSLSYSAINPRINADAEPVSLDDLREGVHAVWTAYQDSRFGYCIARLNSALPHAYLASRDSASKPDAQRCLALTYHAAASVLVKVGDSDLAQLCAERGDIAAQETDDPLTTLSLQRAVAHALLSKGRYEDAVTVVRDGLIRAPEAVSPALVSVIGTLMLVGATASARAGERVEASTFLRHASALADRLGADRNELWTSFGPTNIAIHRVTVAADLGDPLTAVRIGDDLDVAVMPRERQVRHHLEVARALARIGRTDDALAVLLNVEPDAPEQVRQHFITNQIVQDVLRACRTRPSLDLVALARRLGHAA